MASNNYWKRLEEVADFVRVGAIGLLHEDLESEVEHFIDERMLLPEGPVNLQEGVLLRPPRTVGGLTPEEIKKLLVMETTARRGNNRPQTGDIHIIEEYQRIAPSEGNKEEFWHYRFIKFDPNKPFSTIATNIANQSIRQFDRVVNCIDELVEDKEVGSSENMLSVLNETYRLLRHIYHNRFEKTTDAIKNTPNSPFPQETTPVQYIVDLARVQLQTPDKLSEQERTILSDPAYKPLKEVAAAHLDLESMRIRISQHYDTVIEHSEEFAATINSAKEDMSRMITQSKLLANYLRGDAQLPPAGHTNP